MLGIILDKLTKSMNHIHFALFCAEINALCEWVHIKLHVLCNSLSASVD